MRTIDADAFNERIKSKMFELQNAIDYRFRERGEVNGKDRLLLEKYGFASQLIDEQPTINNWIPVSERLPDINDSEVITTCKDDIVRYLFYSHDTKDWWCEEIDYYYPIDFVIAWMPLPEPYKEDDNE